MDNGLLKKLQNDYEQNITKSYGRVDGGFLSENYIVGESNNKYFLKSYRSKYSENDIINIHKVKRYFANHGIPIILPLDDRDGRSYFAYRNHFYGLFPFIESKNIKTEKASLSVVRSIAEMQAKIHLLSRDGLLKIHEKETSLWNKDRVLKIGRNIAKILAGIKNPNQFDKVALRFVALKMKLISECHLIPGDIGLKNDHLIHGDYHAHNLFLDKDGNVQYVYDLEKTVNAPRAYELSRAIDYICLDKYDFVKAGAYLRAYREVYPMSDEEFAKGFLFYYLKSIHSFWIEEHHYLNNNKRTDVFYNKDFEMTQYYSENLNEVIARIIKNSQSEGVNE